MRESQLRQQLAGTLRTAAGQEYWAAAGRSRVASDTNTRRQRRFNRIAENIYADIIRNAKVQASAPTVISKSDRNPIYLTATIAGAAATWALVRKLRNHRTRSLR